MPRPIRFFLHASALFFSVFVIAYAAAKPNTVIQVQRQLTELNYKIGKIDNKIGPKYRNAVSAFQKLHGLTVDGIAGKKVRQALSDAVRVSRHIISIQKQLADLNYRIGKIDSKIGPKYRNAVSAFQKLHGLTVDGVAGRQVRRALKHPVIPKPKRRYRSYHTEVDINKQILIVYHNNIAIGILPISSGTRDAKTPIGKFSITRHIRGVHYPVKNPNWDMYNPTYFNNAGYAIHGKALEVATYPASHGCIRIPRRDSQWYQSVAPIHSIVLIF